MTQNSSTFNRLRKERIIAIMRHIPARAAADTAQALLRGGISCLEVAFDHRNSRGAENTLESIRLLCDRFGCDLCVGAGTVMTEQQAQAAVQAGARYIISPGVDARVIQQTKALGVLSMPGALTPTEAAAAACCGADIVKVFPAGAMGVDYFKALRGPLGHIPMAAVGGVDAGNAAGFLSAGAICLGVGGRLVPADRIAAGDFEAVTRAAQQLRGQIDAWEAERCAKT